jgi:mannose-1-phosphate guanylyltransferase/mannose-6-phosphate isomerase
MSSPEFQTLTEAAAWYDAWLREAALPLWATAGIDPRTGAFQEALTLQGVAHQAPHRARVQARQSFVYASAATAGFGREWLEPARRGFGAYLDTYRRADGLFAALVDAEGQVLDQTAGLYEQDFSILAMAALHAADPAYGDMAAEADRTRLALEAYRHPAGGFRELGSHPFQSNAHMHLLESAMAWEEADGDDSWTRLADEIVALALDHFIDPRGRFLREFFDADWRPAPGDDGRWVEPGHQFEWAWLLERWGVKRNNPAARTAARDLFERGRQGVDRQREVAINVLWDDLSPRDTSARLWPQTEYLKAALILGEEGEAITAARGLARYLDVPTRGTWRDKMRPDGRFIDEPAPASSFYHVMAAILELSKTGA